MPKELRIVFMGTPTFAVTVLDRIVKTGHNIVSVVTAPDRPAGRGQQIRKSEVKLYAESKDLTVIQPTHLKSEEFNQELQNLNADVFIVVAFRMLPAVVWKIPTKGTINLHASLLPQYRGAAPINWAIMNGEVKTGVTTFFINEVIYTGDIIKKQEVDIHEQMTAGELHDVLMNCGADLITETLKEVQNGTISRSNQKQVMESELKPAPKIFKLDCQIRWTDSIDMIYNKIRGLSPYPGAWCKIENKSKGTIVQFKLFSSVLTNDITIPGDKNLKSSENGILFPCEDLFILVDELQMEGKRRMNYKDFLAGNKMYYVGGQSGAYWEGIPEHETIGLTHPFFRDMRSRGYGMTKTEYGIGNDKWGWEFYRLTKGAYGTVIHDGKEYKHPKPENLIWPQELF